MNDRIQEIRDRHAAATQGSWNYFETDDEQLIIYDDTYFNRHIATIVKDSVESREREKANADLIVYAREDVSYLLSEVERLQEEVALAEYPKATGSDASYGGWILDYQFLRDVEMGIHQSEHWEECPSMEGIELALLTAREIMKSRALSHLKG